MYNIPYCLPAAFQTVYKLADFRSRFIMQSQWGGIDLRVQIRTHGF